MITTGTSALHHSAFYGHEDCVHLLIQAGADVNKRNSEGITPLNEAALLCQFQCVDLLLKAGADVNNEKWPSLIYTVTYEDAIIKYVTEKAQKVYKPEKHNQIKCIELLLGAGADVNATDERHNNALIYLSTAGNIPQILMLINAGADVNTHSNAGFTLVMIAAHRGHLESVKLLLTAENINLQNNEGDTALMLAE